MHTNESVWRCLNAWVASVLLLARTAGLVQNAPPPHYETGFPTIAKLSHNVCSVLDPKIRRTLYPQPLLLDKIAQPYFQPVELADGTNKFRLVALSEGSVQLLNGFAHARAVNNFEPGFLNQYLALLAAQEEITPLFGFESKGRGQPLPVARWEWGQPLRVSAREREPLGLGSLSAEKIWAFDTMNLQMSQFNQIAGALLAINLAHHYLGHYQKYSSRLTDEQNRPVPIASIVSPGEWRDAVNKGARNALQCGLGLDGLKAFYDALGQIPTRPAWTLNFLPKDANVGKIKKDLDKIEGSFFLSKK